MSLIEEHPKVREIREQQRKLDDAQKASQARVSALMEPYWQKVAEYEQAAQTAILNGRKPPVRPEEPDLGADRDSAWTFMQERQRLAEQVRQTVREIAPELLEQVEAAKTKLMGKAEKTVATLDDVVRERGTLVSDEEAALRAMDRTVASVNVTAEAVIRMVRERRQPVPQPPTAEIISVAGEAGFIVKEGLPSPADPYDRPRPIVGGARI